MLAKRTKVLHLIIISLLVLFVAYNVLWFYYKYTYFAKVIDCHPEFKRDEIVNDVPYYLYKDETSRSQGTTFNYSICFPLHYLSWTGTYGLAQNIDIDVDNDYQVVNNYVIDILIRPSLFRGYRYELSIVDHTDYQNNYYMQVDRDGNLIRDYSGDAGIILSKASYEIKEAMEAVNGVLDLP